MATVEPPKRDGVDRHAPREEYLFAGAVPHLHDPAQKLWDRLLGFLSWSNGGKDIIHKHSSADFFHPLSEAELLSIYRKLHKCCDEAERELKQAIDYGQQIVLEKKHQMKPSLFERGLKNSKNTQIEGASIRDVPLQSKHEI